MMKKTVLILLLLFLFALPVSAEENTYKELYEAGGIEDVWELAGDDAAKFGSRLGLDPSDPDWVNRLGAETVFSEIWDFLREGGRGPFRAAAEMFALIIIFAAASLSERLSKYKTAISYIFVVLAAAGVLRPMFSLISSAAAAVKGSALFMTSFVPVYSGILTTSGRGITASGMSFLLLFAAEAVNLIASFVVVPLMSCYLGMALVSGVMPSGGALALGETLNRVATWFFSLSLTVFLGLLSIQTAVNSAADNAGVRTVKFVLGSLVPVTGGALSESLGTLTSSMKLLGNSVAMYAVLALSIAALPLVLEILLWRVCLYLVTAVSELFGVKEGVNLFRCADKVLSTLLGIILFSACLFIISLAVVTNSG